jgi:trypsin-like peptidase
VRDPFRSTAWVVALDLHGRPQYAGTCFAYRKANYFLTAAHCVEDLSPDRVSVSIFTDHVEEGLEVIRLERHPSADVAFLQIRDDGPELDVFSPFRGTTDEFEWGEMVVAFGYPEFAARDVAHPTPRYFRGHIQRRFLHDRGRRSYSALELNFGAPAGLSGGPVALAREPWHAVGLVADNLESSTSLAKLDEVVEPGRHYTERVERIVEYAVAVSLCDISQWLDRIAAGNAA